MFSSLFKEAKERKRQKLEAQASVQVAAEAKEKKPAKSDEKPKPKQQEKPQKKNDSKRKRQAEDEETETKEMKAPPAKKAKKEDKKKKQEIQEEPEEQGESDLDEGEEDSDPSVMEFDDDGEAENVDLKMAIKNFIDSGGLGVSSDEEEDGDEDDDANNNGDDENGANQAAERTLTVFVGNLPLDVTQNALKTHFEGACGKTVSIRVLPAKEGKTGTLAFVEFRSKASVDKALKLDGTQFKGRRMLCSLAKNKEEKAVEHEKKKSGESTSGDFSAFIKNLSVTTTTEGLKAAFAHCGPIGSVRIPVNTTTGKARGFGFVDFQDQKSLDKALKIKKMTLDGRQILIEHAATKKRNQ